MKPSGSFGAVTLVMVFAVACFISLAALTYSEAKAELNLAERHAENLRDYYAADSEATRVYARFKSSGDIEATAAALRDEGLPVTVERADDAVTISYICPLDEIQALDVKIQNRGRDWDVVSWRLFEGEISGADS